MVELIWLVQSSTQKELFHFRHFAQISIMDSLRQIQLMVKLVLRFGSIKEKYFLQREIRKEEYLNGY